MSWYVRLSSGWVVTPNPLDAARLHVVYGKQVRLGKEDEEGDVSQDEASAHEQV